MSCHASLARHSSLICAILCLGLLGIVSIAAAQAPDPKTDRSPPADESPAADAQDSRSDADRESQSADNERERRRSPDDERNAQPDSENREANERRPQGWIGIALDPDEAEEGALVGQVYPRSPASRARLRPGDVIVAIDDEKIESAEQLIDHISEMKPGQAVRIQFLRGDNERTVELKLASREDFEAEMERRFGGERRAYRPTEEDWSRGMLDEEFLAEQHEQWQEQQDAMERKLDEVLAELKALRQELEAHKSERTAAKP